MAIHRLIITTTTAVSSVKLNAFTVGFGRAKAFSLILNVHQFTSTCRFLWRKKTVERCRLSIPRLLWPSCLSLRSNVKWTERHLWKVVCINFVFTIVFYLCFCCVRRRRKKESVNLLWRTNRSGSRWLRRLRRRWLRRRWLRRWLLRRPRPRWLRTRSNFNGFGFHSRSFVSRYFVWCNPHQQLTCSSPIKRGILFLSFSGALLLRSILAVLQNNAASGRSLDVADINLPLIMSDLPEAVAGLAPHHVIRERYYIYLYITESLLMIPEINESETMILF